MSALSLTYDENVQYLLNRVRQYYTDGSAFWVEIFISALLRGATKIDIEQTKDYLRVVDNGSTIKSLEDKNTKQLPQEVLFDDPYLSRMSCYVAESIKVCSGHSYFETTVKDLRSRQKISVQEGNHTAGACIELFAVSEKFAKFPEENFLAFPIEIFINDREFFRQDAQIIPRLKWLTCDFGAVSRVYLHEMAETQYCKFYYKGILIHTDTNPSNHAEYIVHLSDKTCQTCWPVTSMGGRPYEPYAFLQLRDAVKSHLRSELEGFFNAFKDEQPEVLCQSFPVYQFYGLEGLFDQLDMIPGAVVNTVYRYPSNASYANKHRFLSQKTGVVDREAIEQGVFKLYTTKTSVCLERGQNFNNLMFLFLQHDKAGLLDVSALGQGHWARAFVIDLEVNSVRVEIKKPKSLRSGLLDHPYFFSLCDYYTLTCDGVVATSRLPAMLSCQEMASGRVQAIIPYRESLTECPDFLMQLCHVNDWFDESGSLDHERFAHEVERCEKWWHAEKQQIFTRLFHNIQLNDELLKALNNRTVTLRISEGELEVLEVKLNRD